MATNTISENITQAVSDFGSIKTAIQAQGVDVDSGTPTSQYGTLISQIDNSQPQDGEYIVNFIGYGVILQSGMYNSGDVVKFPDDPVYDGLTFQGWSCPVSYSDGQVTVTNQNITIGAVFTTTSGKTEIYMTLTPIVGLSVTLTLCTGITEIDWGDGQTSSEQGTHVYSDYGDYVISISGLTAIGGGSSNIFGETSSSVANYYVTDVRLASSVTTVDDYALRYCSGMRRVTLSNAVTSLGERTFYGCFALPLMTIPATMTSIGNYCFAECSSLSFIAFPLGLVNLGTYMFQYDYALCSITLPQGLLALGNYSFAQCRSLPRVTIPNSIESIGGYSFYYCYSLVEIDMTAFTSAITLTASSAIASVSKICKIYFADQTTLNTFSTEENWSSCTNYMYVKAS